jgi:hypothetical protein
MAPIGRRPSLSRKIDGLAVDRLWNVTDDGLQRTDGERRTFRASDCQRYGAKRHDGSLVVTKASAYADVARSAGLEAGRVGLERAGDIGGNAVSL